MKIYEVITAEQANQFIAISVSLNSSNPKYIRPLDVDVHDLFDPTKNRAFATGSIIRWVLKNDNNELMGRIAAFVNKQYKNLGDTFAVGCFGFFECVPNQAAANMLLDTAKQWLLQKNVLAMDGPINFLDRDKWWGLMVEGFDEYPPLNISFNPPYYQSLVEGYGCQLFYKQFYYKMMLHTPLDKKIEERYNRLKAKPAYSVQPFSKKNVAKFAADFVEVFNACYGQHQEGKSTTLADTINMFNKMKHILDERLIWFAYHEQQPIAMWVNIPDLNAYFRKFNGQFGLWQKIKLLWWLRFSRTRRFYGIVFGVVPQFQRLGIDALLMYEAALDLRKRNEYDSLELGWTGDWNPRMNALYKGIGAVKSRTMITYRYIFDPTIPFVRHPDIQYIH